MDQGSSDPNTGGTGTEPAWLVRFTVFSSGLNRAAAFVAIILVVLMTGLILLEIGLRAFSHSTHVTDAWVGYGVAAVTFLSMPWVLEQNSMLKVAVLVSRLSSGPRLVVEIVGVTLSLAAIVFLITFQWAAVIKLIHRGTVSQHYIPVPLWLPESVFFAGLVLLALHLVVRLLRLCLLRQNSEDILTV
jgi:TRAP-type C4-dicarboxylate transport system permease small subunit